MFVCSVFIQDRPKAIEDYLTVVWLYRREGRGSSRGGGNQDGGKAARIEAEESWRM